MKDNAAPRTSTCRTVVSLCMGLLLQSACNDQRPVEGEEQRPPNVIMIVTDDQGCGDVGFTGNATISTPHLDRLAAEGAVFDRFYVSPVCAPTRASLMTGRYHPRTGVLGVIEGREFMVEQERTVAEHLSEAGYSTGLVGKWHLGENYPWIPQAQGFDEFVGFRDGSHPYFDVVLERNGRPFQTEGYLTDFLTDEAIDFVDRHQDTPFFLVLAYNAPHSPLEVPPSYLEPYEHLPEHTALIYGMMASVDENIGRLLERIDRLPDDEEPLLLLLSDNGPLYGGGGYERSERFNCGLRGTKYSVYEGGIRAPLVARWPGRIPSGVNIEHPAAHIDLLPTILDYAGHDASPEAASWDGRSLRPLLEGNPEAWPPRLLFMSYPGEAGQKTSEPAPYPGGMAMTDTFKMVDGTELYNLHTDPGETEDVAGEHPDVLRQLDAAYRQFWEASSNERPPYPRVHVGHPEENPAVLTAHWANVSGGLAFQFGDDPPRYRSIGVHGDRIAQWTPGGEAVWRLDVRNAGLYEISARWLCAGIGNGTGSSPRVRVEIGANTFVQALSVCDAGPRGAVEHTLGQVTLPVGAADLSIRMIQGGNTLALQEVLIDMDPKR